MDRFDILNDIFDCEDEIDRLMCSDEDESEQIEELIKHIDNLYSALAEAE